MKSITTRIVLLVSVIVAGGGIALASTTISTDITTGGVMTANSGVITGSLSAGSGTFTNLTVNGVAAFNGSLSADIIPLQDTATNLSAIVASSGQMVYETDTKYSKAGDGSTSLGNMSPIGFWKNNGSSIFYSSGKVGIGTTSPVSTFSVGGDITATGTLYMANQTGNSIDLSQVLSPTIYFSNGGGGDPTYIGVGGGDMYIDVGNTDDGESNANLYMSVDGNINMSANGLITIGPGSGTLYISGGNLGIGTSTPIATLDISSPVAVASSTTLLLEAPSKGACVIIKDVGGTGYTQLYTMAGAVFAKVHTGSLATCN